MPSISDIIKNKTARDQARTEQLQTDREMISAMRDGALNLITSSPEHFQEFIIEKMSGLFAFKSPNISVPLGIA